MRRFSFKTLTTFFGATLLVLFSLNSATAYAQENNEAAEVKTNVRLVGQPVSPDNKASVILEMEANGNENAVAFSFNFRSDELTYESTSGLAPGVTVHINQLIPGKIGFLLGLPIGQTFSQGVHRLATFNFRVNRTGRLNLLFGDTPVWREVVDKFANVLPAEFTNGFVFSETPVVEFYYVGPTHAELGKPAYVLIGGLKHADGAVVVATHHNEARQIQKWEVGEIKPGEEVERFVFVPPAGYTRFEVVPIKNGQRLLPITAMGVNRP